MEEKKFITNLMKFLKYYLKLPFMILKLICFKLQKIFFIVLLTTIKNQVFEGLISHYDKN